MKEKESRRGVPLRAGVGLVAVAATVAASFALANPASAAVGDTVTLTPPTPTENAGTPQAFIATTNGAKGDTITISVTEPGNAANDATGSGTNPLTLTGGTLGTNKGTQAKSGSNWTDSYTFTYTADNQSVGFLVTSAQPGDVSVTATDNTGSGTDTSTLTVNQASNVSQSPASATSYTDGTSANTGLQTFTIKTTYADGTAVPYAKVNVGLDQASSAGTPTALNDPLIAEDASGSAITLSQTQTSTDWVDNAAVYTGADGTAQVQIGSTQTGTVTVRSAAYENDGTTVNTSGAARATSTLTVNSLASGDTAVHTLTVDPANQARYVGEDATFKVQPLGTSNQPVASATVHGTVTSGPDKGTVLTAQASGSDGSPASLTLSGAKGTDVVEFWVNTNPLGTSSADSGEPTVNASASFSDVPAGTDIWTLTTPSDSTTPANTLPAGQETKVPFTVTVTDNAKKPVSGVMVYFTPSGSAASGIDDQTATTDANGQATVTFTVPKANAADGNTLTVDVAASTLSGGSSKATDHVDFAAATVTLHPATKTVQVADGGTVSLPVTVADQFGNVAGSGDSLSYVISGRNSAQSTAITGKTATVASNGTATVSYADSGTGVTSDTVTITDTTHPAYGTSVYTVEFVKSVAPSSVTVQTQPSNYTPPATPTTAVGTTVENVDGSTNYIVQFKVEGTDGTSTYPLIGSPVVVTVNQGFVGDSDAADSTAGTSVTVETDTNGIATAYVGSAAAGTQTITATAGTQSVSADSIAYKAGAPTTVTLTGPKTVKAGGSAAFTAKVADDLGNGIAGETVYFTATDPSVLPGAVSPLTGVTGPKGTVTVTIKAGSAGATITATDANITGPDTTNSASAAYKIKKVTHHKKTEKPKISVSSRTKGIVIVTVTTHPKFKKGMIVSLFKKKHGHWQKTGHIRVDNTGWGQVTMHAPSKVHLILRAKGNSHKYIEKYSKIHKIRVK